MRAVNFPLDEPVPVKLIGKMSKFQAGEIEAGAKTKVKDRAEGGAKIKIKAKAKVAKNKTAKKKPGAARK